MITPEGGDYFAIIQLMLKISGKDVRSWKERKSGIISAINLGKSIKEDSQNFISNFFGLFSIPCL